MVGGFTAALARADAAVSAMMDETVFRAVSLGGVRPGARRDVNAKPVPDPDRPEFSFVGTLDSDPSFNSFSPANRTAPGELDNRHVASICITALVTEWGWVPRKDDQILTEDAVYSVVAVDRDGTQRAVFWVNRKR